MSILVIVIVLIIAALLCIVVPARLGFFGFGKTILGSLFKKPATLMYPVVPREWEERTRGSISIDGDSCIGCGICQGNCPTDAIEVDKKNGKWTIQRMQCIQCGACADTCPKKCLTMENLYTIPDVVKVVDTYEIPADPNAKAPGEESSGGGDLTCADSCVFCGLCVKACPADAIKVDRKAKTWEVDTDACVKCGACVDKCPKGSLSFGGDDAASADGPLSCDEDACIYCGLCAKNCPAEALAVDRKAKSWEVDEDTCVKCGVCIDKCPKKCLSFGGAGKPAAPSKKEIAAVDTDKCVYCGACANECAADALDVEVDKWDLDEEKCAGCGACADVCPADAITMKEVK